MQLPWVKTWTYLLEATIQPTLGPSEAASKAPSWPPLQTVSSFSWLVLAPPVLGEVALDDWPLDDSHCSQKQGVGTVWEFGLP